MTSTAFFFFFAAFAVYFAYYCRAVSSVIMMEAIRNCVDPKEALEKNTGTYGRFAEAAKIIDPRKQ